MAMMEISVVPLGTGRTSLSAYVAKLHRVLLKQKGIQVELNAMGTILTGPAPRLFQVASLLHQQPFAQGVKRVYTVIKLDDRRDKQQSTRDKVASVLKKL